MENLLISACLLGVECKYSGGSNALPEETIGKLRARYRLIPVCPETARGTAHAARPKRAVRRACCELPRRGCHTAV